MKTNFFKYIFVFFIIGIITYAVYVLYFKDSNREEEQPQDEQLVVVEQITNLRLGVSNFDTINPLISNNKEILNIDKLIFDSLITITQDYKAELNLAKECSKISDYSYIIKLDNNIKWHDGSDFTAKDVSFTIDRLKEGKSVYSSNVEKISNVEVIDANTLKINLVEPVAFFEYNLTFPILPNNYYLNEDFYASTKVPIGTGMFSISEITSNNIKLIKNEKWWNKENKNSKIDTINIKIFSQIGEVYNSFKMGNIDIFTTYNTSLENYIGTMGYEKQEIHGREFDYLAFNCENVVLKDKNVRKAINYTIDKTNIVSSVFNNEYYTCENPLDYGSYLYENESTSLGYNPEQAKKILTDGGWEYKYNRWQKKENYYTRKLNLTLTVNSTNTQRVQVAENIKNQLAQIGINVTINKVSDSKYLQILQSKNYEMILTGVYNSFSPNLNPFFGDGNLQNYNNNEIKTILNDVKNIKEESLLKEKYKRVMEIYNEEQPFVSLYRNKVTIVKDQNLIGQPGGNSYFSYYNVYNWYRI